LLDGLPGCGHALAARTKAAGWSTLTRKPAYARDRQVGLCLDCVKEYVGGA
jgi:hypothetical protein